MPQQPAQLQAFTWETHRSSDPDEQVRTTISARFTDKMVHVVKTARFSEYPGQGENATVEVDIPITWGTGLTLGTFVPAYPVTVTSKPNSQGKTVSFKATDPAFSFQILWGGRGATFFGSVYQAVAKPFFGDNS
jgi:hypothetical protein